MDEGIFTNERIFRMDMFYPSTVDVPGRIEDFYAMLRKISPGAHAEYRNGSGFTVSVVGSAETGMHARIRAAAREVFC